MIRGRGLYRGMFRGMSPKSYKAAAGSYLFQETFEAAGYDNAGWTESVAAGGTVDEDDTTATVLAGSQQLKIYGALASVDISYTNSSDFTASGNLYVRFLFKIKNTLPIASSIVIYLNAAGSAAKQWVSLETTGTLKVSVGAKSATTTATIAVNTKYWVWVTYLKGTGANQTGRIAFSSDGATEPTSDNGTTQGYNQFTDGARTDDLNSIRLGMKGEREVYFDQLLVSASSIT